MSLQHKMRLRFVLISVVALLAVITALPTATTSDVPSPTPENPNELPGGNIPCNCGQGQRVRREIGSLSNSETTAFVNAFKALKDTNDGRSIFERFSDIHRLNQFEAHNTAQFLPWHREYLFQVECRLRQINPSMTIPYWDWSLDSADPGLSPVWEVMGGAARNASIPNEPFQNWSSSVPEQHDIIRGFNSGQAGSFEVELESAAMIRNFHNDGSLTYSAFNAALEAFHGTPHIGIGGRAVFGDMSLLTRSPNDPMFFLHHAFVDKIWWEWQKNAGKEREYNGQHISRNVTFTNTTEPWNVNVGEMFARDECVSYEAPTRPGVASTSRVVVRERLARRLGKTRKWWTSRAASEQHSEVIAKNAAKKRDATISQNIPQDLRVKAENSAIVQEALVGADKKDVKKLAQAPEDRVEAVAERIAKNHVLDIWASINGFPKEKVELAKKIAAKADPSVQFNEVENGSPPGG